MKTTTMIQGRSSLYAVILALLETKGWARVGATTTTTASTQEQREHACQLYLAPTKQRDKDAAYLGLYAGVGYAEGQAVGDENGDIIVSIIDANKNEWSPWHEFTWLPEAIPGSHLNNDFLHDLFLPGVGTITACGDDGGAFNIERVIEKRTYDSAGVHRDTHPTAGSFSYQHGYAYKAGRDIAVGEEILMACSVNEGTVTKGGYPKRQELDWLEKYGVCVDSLAVKQSTIPGIGRGAFATRDFRIGQRITVSPLIHLDRSQFNIYEQRYEQEGELTRPIESSREHGIEYKGRIKGKQLLLNYAYGEPDSNVMLLPYGLGVNFINHDRSRVNAYIRWHESGSHEVYKYLRELSHFDMLDESAGTDFGLSIEIVAMRNIRKGDEIFLDYGDEWIAAWEQHVAAWNETIHQSGSTSGFFGHTTEEYISAADYQRKHGDKAIRTVDEEGWNSYPENIATGCYHETCLHQCDVVERIQSGAFYKVTLYSRGGAADPEQCRNLPEEGKEAEIPASDVVLIDAPYTTDVSLSNTFRHEIGLPQAFYPTLWKAADPKSKGDFIGTPLGPGDLERVRWSDTGQVVTRNGFRLGLNPRVREVLLDYCDKMKITPLLKHVTSDGNALEAGDDAYITLDGKKWYLQRPESKWRSNLQWLSPADNPAHEHYLQALSVAGFDESLKAIGEQLGMDGLVVFHVTFIAVSSSTKGYLHHDVTETGDKTFNVIVPLILANETGPELDLQNSPPRESEDDGDSEDSNSESSGDYRVGRYRYEYDVAAMTGDDAYHASSAVDYRAKGEMRMAATIYIADVNWKNVDSIMSGYTQAYPPQDKKLLLSWAGRHWRSDDPSVTLPKPASDHILLSSDEAAEEL